ncbi:aminomethyltransferase [[Emmonsia] crescens]|uniref:Aminomethyltransferase n=1 Tax=[Emmonsia] crescens TaxID=73230 RepID=A0A2B7ZN87_9EURO|nr:aminomethyltransferase [Emmonsia crescens]
MSFPYSHSVLDHVAGLILTILIRSSWGSVVRFIDHLVCWNGSLAEGMLTPMTRQLCLRHPEVQDICDIGQYLFWDSRIAWYLMAVMFLLNNIFIQIASLAALFKFISLTLATVFAAIESHPVGNTPDPAGGEPIVLPWPAAGTTFVAAMGAFLNISYIFIGQATLPSFIAEMKNPKEFNKSLYVVTIAETIVLSIVGSVVYAYTGNQYMTSPAFDSLSDSVCKKVFSFMVPTLIFFGILYASVSTRFVFFRLFDGTPSLGQSHACWMVVLESYPGSYLGHSFRDCRGYPFIL